MIDEKKLIKERPEWLNPDCAGNEEYNKGWNACNKYWCNTIKQQPKVGDWIPCSERLPSEVDFIASYRRNKYSAEFIVMIEGATRPTTLYFRKTGIWVDENGNPYRVIAWQPLPEPYNAGTVRKQTNADRIRAMSDEELDEMFARLLSANEVRSAIVCEDYCPGCAFVCKRNRMCEEYEGIEPSESIMKWLQSEVEETYE